MTRSADAMPVRVPRGARLGSGNGVDTASGSGSVKAGPRNTMSGGVSRSWRRSLTGGAAAEAESDERSVLYRGDVTDDFVAGLCREDDVVITTGVDGVDSGGFVGDPVGALVSRPLDDGDKVAGAFDEAFEDGVRIALPDGATDASDEGR